MNDSTVFDTHEHDEVALLLPWYVNQSLDPDEHQRVVRHVHGCLTCRREIRALSNLQTSLRDGDPLELSAQASFRNMRSKLGTAARDSHPTRPAPSTMSGWRQRLTRRNVVAWAVAASVMLAFAPTLLRQVPTLPQGEFETLSSSSKSDGEQLQVVFAPSLATAQREHLLQAIGGEVIGNPNSLGAYRVRLHSASGNHDPVAALSFLRTQPGVLLAEPVMTDEAGKTP